MAELVLERKHNTDRWLGDAAGKVKKFRDLCISSEIPVEICQADSLSAITLGESRALVVGHPLWHTAEDHLNDQQLKARESLLADYPEMQIDFCDVRLLARKPQEFIVELLEKAE